jgi:phospholipid/cholesterol/gamma-HCH transport system substrate-binding protein
VKISNEFKIGLMAIVVVAVSVWGYNFLKGKNILKTSNTYYVRYANIEQLAPTSPVLIRGLNVGSVESVALDDDMQTIIAKLDIKRGIRIPADAQAVIISTGLMGGVGVVVRV